MSSQMSNLGTLEATVINNIDPLQQSRIQLQIPQVLGSAPSNWAVPTVVSPTVPKVGERVWAHFAGGDTNRPVYAAAKDSGIQVGDTTDGFFVLTTGITAYHNGSVTFSVSTSGVATFSGTLTAPTIAGGTISGATVTGGTISGATVETSPSYNSGGVVLNSSGIFAYDNTGQATFFATASGVQIKGVVYASTLYTNGNSSGNHIELGKQSSGADPTVDELRFFVNNQVASLRTPSSSPGSLMMSLSDTGAPQFLFQSSPTDANHNPWIRFGAGGVKSLNSSPALQVRTAADNAYANFQANDITCHTLNYTGSLNPISRRDMKTDIQPFAGSALAKIAQAPVYTFLIKPMPEEEPSDFRRIGPILDEMPEELHSPNGWGYDQMNFNGMVWKAIQELHALVKDKE